MRRDLAALSVILDAKEAEFRRQLIVQNTANKQLPIVELVRLVSEKACDVSTAPSEKLTGMIESLFGGSFLQGMILCALDTVLGNASGGEKQTKGFTVMLLHGDVVRVDYYVYSYTFESDGVVTKPQNGLVFAISMATVKLASVNSEVIALLSGLTAEGSAGYMKLHNAKMKEISNKAKQKADSNYTTAEAAKLIMTLFGGDSKPGKDQADATSAPLCARDKLTKILEDTEPPVAPESGEKPTDAQVKAKADERRLKVNQLLAGATVVSEIPKSEIDQVFEEQKKILDKMTQLYKKMSLMKRSTDRASNAAGSTEEQFKATVAGLEKQVADQKAANKLLTETMLVKLIHDASLSHASAYMAEQAAEFARRPVNVKELNGKIVSFESKRFKRWFIDSRANEACINPVPNSKGGDATWPRWKVHVQDGDRFSLESTDRPDHYLDLNHRRGWGGNNAIHITLSAGLPGNWGQFQFHGTMDNATIQSMRWNDRWLCAHDGKRVVGGHYKSPPPSDVIDGWSHWTIRDVLEDAAAGHNDRASNAAASTEEQYKATVAGLKKEVADQKAAGKLLTEKLTGEADTLTKLQSRHDASSSTPTPLDAVSHASASTAEFASAMPVNVKELNGKIVSFESKRFKRWFIDNRANEAYINPVPNSKWGDATWPRWKVHVQDGDRFSLESTDRPDHYLDLNNAIHITWSAGLPGNWGQFQFHGTMDNATIQSMRWNDRWLCADRKKRVVGGQYNSPPPSDVIDGWSHWTIRDVLGGAAAGRNGATE